MFKDYKIAFKPLAQIYRDDLGTAWRSIALLTGVIFTGALLSVSGPYVFSRIIDDVPKEPGRWIAAFSLYAILAALSTGIQRSTQYLAVIHSERLEYVATTRFFERITRKKPSFFTDHNPAEIQQAQTQGASAASILMQIVLIYFVPGFATFLFSTIMLGAAISPEIILIVICYGVAFIGLTLASNRFTNRYLEKAIDAGQQNAGFVGNAISMIEPLRHTRSTAWMQQRFADSAGSIYENWRLYSLRRIGFVATISLALGAQLLISFYLLFPRYEQGTLSVGDIVLFNTLLLQLNIPFEMIGQSIGEAMRSLARFMPCARMWGAPEELDEAATELPLARPERVELQNVGYRYENGRGVEGVSFTAAPGRLTFITGETGSGKSTLFKLLQKNMAPEKGFILIDGVDLKDIGKDQWFSVVGIVPQEIQLLNDSLRTNIVLGRPHDEERLGKTAEQAAILKRIEGMTDGFDTIVGERGLKLSGGERQRIAIARALYGAPSILLLDEASSALDEETEREIMDQLRKVDADLTIIAITHRQSSIRPEDQVVTLKAGEASDSVSKLPPLSP
ncbi:ABC transporter ATP-binding protein [Agrobacterium larrymoorei]|uniref:ABC transporter ATP-binding protein n=1 Tax=Agrobacterium larrymoorei TaxID=160699 RepID=A0AAF0KCX3_9HYPH|nr:ABC transporter ATP-binding protein [Agrobacterium larrymoorei]WHA40273.1 ABC transporter ATP-binding protein [Agrobacterium larrymoorei]